MKKAITIAAIVGLVILVLSGCSGVSQEDYNNVQSLLQDAQSTIEQLTIENESISEELAKAKAEYDILETKFDSLDKEFDEYKNRMKPYEDLEEAEAEARQIEADAAIEAARIEAEELAAAEAAEKDAKEKAGYETGITYDQLARTPDDYQGELVKFYGEVVQEIYDPDETDIRLAIDGDYDQIIFCGFDPGITSTRVMEGDWITVYGKSFGLYSYESTMSGVVTIPSVWVDKIDQ